jgi:hypothetical protein
MMSAECRPKSPKHLDRSLQRDLVSLPDDRRRVALKNVKNAVLCQFLPKGVCLKGGASISLRYPLAEARVSRDFDALIELSSERFAAEIEEKLAAGWEGFTGTLEIEERRNLPSMEVGMRPYIVHLLYLGSPWCALSLEAAPDHSGFVPRAQRVIDGDVADLLGRLGFRMTTPLMISPLDQLADKLHAVSNPNKRRGRDLSDIALIVSHEDLSMDELRSRVRHVEQVENTHAVHMLEESNKDEYRGSMTITRTPISFDKAWEITQALLEQVDEDHKELWRARLNTQESQEKNAKQ